MARSNLTPKPEKPTRQPGPRTPTQRPAPKGEVIPPPLKDKRGRTLWLFVFGTCWTMIRAKEKKAAVRFFEDNQRPGMPPPPYKVRKATDRDAEAWTANRGPQIAVAP